MKCRIEFLGDIFEDREELKIACNIFDIYHTLQEMRSRLSYRLINEEISDDEEKFLENLLEEMYVPGME